MSVNGRLLHSGHAWIELKRLHMSRIGSWLVFQFPRRSVSPRVNPFLFFKSSVVISSSTFNDVLSLSLSFSPRDERRVVGFDPARPWTWASKPSTETWKRLVELFMKRAWHGERKIEGGEAVSICPGRVYYFPSSREHVAPMWRIRLNIENKRWSRSQLNL